MKEAKYMAELFVTKVCRDDETKELYLAFPPDFIETMQIVEDTFLVWTLEEDGSILIKKGLPSDATTESIDE